MERYVSMYRLTMVLVMAAIMAAPAAYAQITMPCNASMLSSSLIPCMNFLTNSSGNGTSPTADCCNSIKTLTSGSRDCMCLIGNVPFSIPINRTLAISLPRACNLPGVPLKCKTIGSPLPAPGPASLGPFSSPASTPSAPSPASTPSAPSPAAPSPSPQGSSVESVLPSPVTPSLPPQPEATLPPQPEATLPSPSATTESGRSDLTPSSAVSSYSFLPSAVLFVFGFAVFKHY